MEEQIKPVHFVIVLLSYYLDYSATTDALLFHSLANGTMSGLYAPASKECLWDTQRSWNVTDHCLII